jgi:hypothetical protein
MYLALSLSSTMPDSEQHAQTFQSIKINNKLTNGSEP